MRRRLKIIINKDGFVIEAEGYRGTACEISTTTLAAKLGIKEEERFKQEYYEPDQEVQQHVENGNN